MFPQAFMYCGLFAMFMGIFLELIKIPQDYVNTSYILAVFMYVNYFGWRNH